ncbi:hypothetical protein [Tistrella mobilis]|uniref:hypothetical protein n=1 Tax=Tistrella mobilis TaxID=171437 RepID=UPI0035592F04
MKYVLPIAGLAALALAVPPVAVQAEDYDIDCAVILCMAGGFPASAPCSAAHGYMMKRLKKGKPPFGTCAMSDGKAFTDYDLDMGIHYYCEAGLVMRWPDERDNWSGNRPGCYIEEVAGRDDERRYTYVRAAAGGPYMEITISPGSAKAYRSGKLYY